MLKRSVINQPVTDRAIDQGLSSITIPVCHTKESDGIDDPMVKIGMKSHSDHSDSGIGKMLILIDAYFVILLQCNKMTK